MQSNFVYLKQEDIVLEEKVEGWVGAHGVLYKGWDVRDPDNKKPCVVKVLKPKNQGDEKEKQKIDNIFFKEYHRAKRANQLQVAPRIVGAYQTDNGKGKAIVMEPGDYLTLEEVKQRTKDDPLQRKSLTQKLLRNLKTLHEGNLAHLDLKPSHVLVVKDDDSANIHLIDYGHAESSMNMDNYQLTLPHKGTIGFRPPEVYLSSSVKSLGKVDVYASGVLAACMLGGDKFTDLVSKKKMREREKELPVGYPKGLKELFHTASLWYALGDAELDAFGAHLTPETEIGKKARSLIPLLVLKSPPSELSQLQDKIFDMMLNGWKEIIKRLAGPNIAKQEDQNNVANAKELQFILKLMSLNPEQRPSAADALNDPYLNE